MTKKMLVFTILSLSLAGSLWALQAAQDPVQQTQTTPAAVATTQTDLSGTYTGTFRCEAAGLTGDTTLTINGNEFTTSDGKTGRIVASTTSGYTAVALSIPGSDPTAAPTVISMRGNKRGNRLTLTPVAGSTMKCSFTPSRGVARNRRGQQTTPAATGAEVANPAAAPTTTAPSTVPAESPMPAQTPSPSPSPTAMPTPVPNPSPSPAPSPMPTPTPGEPVPSPTPGESPSPEASPTPTPSPSPSPRM